jgi:hypothetical protein
MINGAVYQLALVLLGEDQIMNDYPLPLFDLDVLVQPFLREWLDGILSDMQAIIKRCLENDRGLSEDSQLKYVPNAKIAIYFKHIVRTDGYFQLLVYGR